MIARRLYSSFTKLDLFEKMRLRSEKQVVSLVEKTYLQKLKMVSKDAKDTRRTTEQGGPVGPEPTRFGDWEKAGRCTDF